MSKIPLIINLQSGTAKKKYGRIKENLSAFKVYEISKVADFDAAYKNILSKKPKRIVLAGGDGTIIKGIESLLAKGYKGNFGILPFGTANYLARNLDTPLEPHAALSIAAESKTTKTIPLACVNDHLFALMMSVGLSRRVSDNVDDKLKQKIGQLAYAIELVRQARQHQAFKFTITSSSRKRKITGKTHQLLVYNSDLNRQAKLVPDHSLFAPSVKVLITRSGKSMTKLLLGFMLHLLSFGAYKGLFKVYELEDVHITTIPQQKASIDGEVIGTGPFDVRASYRDVSILV